VASNIRNVVFNFIVFLRKSLRSLHDFVASDDILWSYLARSSLGEGCIVTGSCSDPGHFAARCAHRSDIDVQICLDIR
jgi:hypothetical protein